MSPSAAITIGNELAALARVFEFCAQFADAHAIPSDKRFALEVCVEEIVTNVIKYGYPTGTEGEITVRLALDPPRLLIEVEDEGVPFDPTATAPVDVNQDLADRPIGGLGIHMVKSMMAELHYSRNDSRNLLTMVAALR